MQALIRPQHGPACGSHHSHPEVGFKPRYALSWNGALRNVLHIQIVSYVKRLTIILYFISIFINGDLVIKLYIF